ncbi:hypothetical protein ROG8370_00260 [Roseovarius gaetbuli]|uniref:Holliday junction resolvase RuvC n=1 Tax=Roseovarius gaetbuli TaxID=1356575 RepID=A0A1X6Y6U1_9RHOB|nr:hypothetical protein ROG8370_00260 [Roseovarius gaetbuli]
MTGLKVLAVAAANRRVGYAYFENWDLVYWTISTKAGEKPLNAVAVTQDLITRFAPDVLVSQKVTPALTKSKNTKKVISAIARTGKQNDLICIAVPRLRKHKNKYEEAEALAKIFPQVADYLPQPRQLHHSKEPRNTVLFEAIALAVTLFEDEDQNLLMAQAMG